MSCEFPLQCTAELADTARWLGTSARMGSRPCLGTPAAGMAAVGSRRPYAGVPGGRAGDRGLGVICAGVGPGYSAFRSSR